MSDTPSPPPRPTTSARVPLPPPPAERDPATSGCLKWGLVGCAALGVVLIVGLILFMKRAPELMDRVLGAAGQQVLSAAGPDVSPAARDEFRREFQRFVEAAKANQVKPEEIRAVQTKVMEALRDGTVTPEEMAGLIATLKKTPGR